MLSTWYMLVVMLRSYVFWKIHRRIVTTTNGISCSDDGTPCLEKWSQKIHWIIYQSTDINWMFQPGRIVTCLLMFIILVPVARSVDSVIPWIAKTFKLVKKLFIVFLRQRNFVIFEIIFYFSDCSVQILSFSLFKRFY